MVQSYTTSSIKQPYTNFDTNTNITTNTNSTKITTTSTISSEAQGFATSRYSFPPFIFKFKANKIDDKAAIEDLINYSTENFSFEINLAGFRMSTNRCNANERNLLIFVKKSSSFSFLYWDIKWPDHLNNITFTLNK